MALKISFYRFQKKTDSTARPTAPAETLNCLLIEPCTIIAPEISIQHKNPTGYNYCYIPEFARYYFVNNWVYSSGLWIAKCNVDYLASWKDYIGANAQYITRASAQFDGEVTDVLYPATSDLEVVTVQNSAGGESGDMFKSRLTDGVYVVGIINNDTTAVGCVSYYVFSNQEFRRFCSYLMGDPSWLTSQLSDIPEGLAKSIVNPFQFVASCMWFPVSSFPTSGGGAISYGWYQLPGAAGAKLAPDPLRLASAFFKVPKHPQEERGKYLNRAPYSHYRLDIPCFGQFNLDANAVGNSESVSVQCMVDAVSGGGVMQVFSDSGTILSVQTQVGVPIQIGQMAVNALGIASNISGGITNAFTGNIAGTISNIVSGIKDAFVPSVDTQGTNGMVASYHFPPVLTCEFYKITDEDNEHRGRPLCKKLTPASLGGYMLVADAEISAPCTDGEKQSIISAMEGGFFYE